MHDQSHKVQQVRLKAIFKEKELWLLVLLGILYFHRPLFLQETFFFREILSYLMPQKQLVMDFMQSEELPLWDPYLYGGQPSLANIGSSVLYPSNLLFFFLPFFRAFNINIVLHFILSPVFAYLCARGIGLRQVSSFIVGLVYGFCGYNLSYANLPSAFFAVPFLPLLVLCWHLFLSQGSGKWFLITVIIGVIRMFTGSPEANMTGLLFLLMWSLLYPYAHISLPRRVGLWILLGSFIVGIALVQLLPTAEMILQSFRAKGVSYPAFAKWSLPPGRLPEIFVPNFLGYVYLEPFPVYWGKNIVDSGMPYVINIYVGCVTFFLACVGGLYRDDNNIFPFRVRISLFVLLFISLLLSSGRFLPFFHLAYQYVPFISIFRYPIKFLSVGLFPLALLAGYASEILFGISSSSHLTSQDKSITRSRRSRFLADGAVLWGIAIFLLIFTATFWLSTRFANSFQEVFFKQSGGEIACHSLGLSFAHISAIWLLMTLLYQYSRLKITKWQHWILAGILVMDLLSAGKHINPTIPEAIVAEEPAIVPIIHREIGEGRFFRAKDPAGLVLSVPPNNIFQISPPHIILGYRWALETLYDYRATLYRIPVIFHDTLSLGQIRLDKLKHLIYSLPWEQRIPLLSASGVTIVFTWDEISLPGIERILEMPHFANKPFFLYRNHNAAARVEFVTNWQFVTSDKEALGIMLEPGYDPRKHVVLQQPESQSWLPFFSKKAEEEVLSMTQSIPNKAAVPEACGPPKIQKQRSNTHSAEYSVSTICDGYLVFSEQFYPGWYVNIDEKPAAILRANYAFSAVFLPAGEHKLERFYRPNSLTFGLLSSIVCCSILLIITYKGWLITDA